MSVKDHVEDFFTHADWDGWVYPLGSEFRAIKVGNFDDYDSCILSLHTYVSDNYTGWDTVHYECGYKCKLPDRPDASYNCAVTRD